MSLIRLALSNLTASTLASAVNILLLALGTASISILLLGSAQLGSTLTRNAAGIDLVIGAKGSPLQLVLAGVYHADVPPGNISLAEANQWALILASAFVESSELTEFVLISVIDNDAFGINISDGATSIRLDKHA